jgi:hypothetical protein
MDTQQIPNPVVSIFDGEGSGWFFPSAELCKRENVSPNLLAYCEAGATLALVVKRSFSGQDFALSEAGLIYLETTLAKGTLKDGKPVRAAYVVLAAFDQRNRQQLKVVSYSSAQETRRWRNGQSAYPGKFGNYWWITAGTLSDGDEAF